MQYEWQTWNNGLATAASYNAQRCIFGDDQCRDTAEYRSAGENVGIIRTSPDVVAPQDAIRQIHGAWFDEYQRANMAQISRYPNPAPT